MKTKVIDNCIPLEHQDKIVHELLTTKYFPWYYCDDITKRNEKDSQARPGLSHHFVDYKKSNSSYTSLVQSIVSKYSSAPIIQAKAFLQFPLNLRNTTYDTPHIDFTFPHMVYLYYVVDADGDTLLFEDSKIIKRITPKKGRVMIFNGQIHHTAEQPRNDIRCIINFDVESNGKNSG